MLPIFSPLPLEESWLVSSRRLLTRWPRLKLDKLQKKQPKRKVTTFLPTELIASTTAVTLQRGQIEGVTLYDMSSIENVQLKEQTDPLRAKLDGFEPHTHYPINYPVANFGMDHEIEASILHEKEAAKRLGIKWELKKNEDGTWMHDFPGPGIKNGGVVNE